MLAGRVEDNKHQGGRHDTPAGRRYRPVRPIAQPRARAGLRRSAVLRWPAAGSGPLAAWQWSSAVGERRPVTRGEMSEGARDER